MYGEADPAFTAQVSGLLGGDAEDVIDYTLARNAGEDAHTGGSGDLEPLSEGYVIVPHGAAVQGNYQITFHTAAFSIEPRPVEVTSASAVKVYDGTALTAHDAEVTSELDFLPGEAPAYTYTGSQTLIGQSENTFAVVPASSSKLANYRITLVPGTLNVTEADEGTTIDPSLVAKKTHEGTAFSVGDEVSYTITAKNIYDEPKTIRFTELAGITLSQDVFTDVAPGATVTATATKTITAEDAAARSFDNRVQVRFDGSDDVYEATDTILVLEQRLVVTKTILNPVPSTGWATTFCT